MSLGKKMQRNFFCAMGCIALAIIWMATTDHFFKQPLCQGTFGFAWPQLQASGIGTVRYNVWQLGVILIVPAGVFLARYGKYANLLDARRHERHCQNCGAQDKTWVRGRPGLVCVSCETQIHDPFHEPC